MTFPSLAGARPMLAGLLLALAAAGAAVAASLFPPVAEAPADIEQAIAQAAAGHRRVLIDFGANWCGDCRALEANLHRSENAGLVEAGFVVVHVNVGVEGITDNFDVARGYGIDLDKGVPALAVLDEGGHLLHAQRNGEFESMRTMDPVSVHEFLVQWMPPQAPEKAGTPP